MIDPEKKKKYLKTPYHCPFCNSRSIEGDQYDGDFNQVWQKVHCNHCHADWTDVYTLTDVED